MLDGELASIRRIAIDDGRELASIGVRGEGPGDLAFGPVVVGSRQRMARIGDNTLIVIDDRRGHLFSAGRSSEFIVDSVGSAALVDAHVAVLDDSTIIYSHSRRWRSGIPQEERTALHVVRSRIERGRVVEPVAIMMLRNPMVMFDSSPGLMPRAPYRNLFRRTWGAGGGVIHAVSYTSFGICRFSDAGELIGSVRMDAEPRPVDGAEQERELRSLYGEVDGVLPSLGISPRDYLKGYWPDHAPWYFDLLVGPGGEALAVRLAPGGQIVADLYTAAGSSVASYLIPDGMALQQLRGDSLMAFDMTDGLMLMYELDG